MTGAPPGITEFLYGRIAEEEAAVDRALRPFSDLVALSGVSWWRDTRVWARVSGLGDDDAFRLSLFHPQRVLAECGAKREIVRIHGHGTRVVRGECRPGDGSGVPHVGDEVPCRTLCALASPYAAHADFDPAWAL